MRAARLAWFEIVDGVQRSKFNFLPDVEHSHHGLAARRRGFLDDEAGGHSFRGSAAPRTTG